MSNATIKNTFLALMSLKIAEIEKIYGKNFPLVYIEIRVVDELPLKNEKIELESDLLNTLIKQGWNIGKLNISLEKPAIVSISFQLSE